MACVRNASHWMLEQVGEFCVCRAWRIITARLTDQAHRAPSQGKLGKFGK